MSKESYLETATSISERLCTSAVWHEERCTWLGGTLEWDDKRMMVYRSFGGEFYDGSSGVAWFLGNLWRLEGKSVLRHTAEGAIRHALRYSNASEDVPMGLYDGLIGIALVAVRLGKIFDNDELVRQGDAMATRAVERLQGSASTDPIDLLSGNAGIALGLVILGTELGREDLQTFAFNLGNHVLSQAQQHANGWLWSAEDAHAVDGQHYHNPCSYAHGNSGIAHALDELHAVIGKITFKQAAMESIRYERSWFDRRWSSWADLRSINLSDLDQGQRPPVANHWCHGSVGIGLQRLRSYELTRDFSLLAEAQAALIGARNAANRVIQEDAQTPTFEANFSVCHGLAGTADLLLYGYEVLGNKEYLEAASALGEFGYDAMKSNDGRWRCGLYEAGETPGLMLGLAGIGMLYLRLHAPGRFAPVGILTNRHTKGSKKTRKFPVKKSIDNILSSTDIKHTEHDTESST